MNSVSESEDSDTEESISGTLRLGHITISAKKYKFSSKVIHHPEQDISEYSEYFGNDDLPIHRYSLEVFANGNTDENENFVSVVFRPIIGIKNYEVTCLISVIDTLGNQRFSQSFKFSGLPSPFPLLRDCGQVINIDKYISREILLNEPADLLPNDILTLHIDLYPMNCVENFFSFYDIICIIRSSFEIEESTSNKRFYLLLDSELVKHLCEESNYFQRILNTSMIEKEKRRMNIPVKEYAIFHNIARILLGVDSLLFESIRDIFDMYVIADKYDIPIITKTCLCFIKLYISNHSAEEIQELASEYEHWNMKNIIKSLQINTDETEASECKFQSKEHIVEPKWTYTYEINSEMPLHFEKQIESSTCNEENMYDFYS